MIRTIFFSTILLSICSLIQSTFLGAISIFGITPDIGLVVLIWLSYKNGIVEGSITGFISGIMEDCISSSPLGLNAFIKTFIAMTTGFLHGSFSIDRLLFPFALGTIGTVLKAFSSLLLSGLFGNKIHYYSFLDKNIWIEALYNGILAPVLFLILSLFKKLLVMEDKHE